MSGRPCSEACAVFDARDLATPQEAADRAVVEDQSLPGQLVAQFVERDVRRLVQHGHNRRATRLDPARALVTAQRFRLRIALFAFKLAPAAVAGRSHTKPLACMTMSQTFSDSGQNTKPKINRRRLSTCLPTSIRQTV